ncbi:MAG: cation:proton antiporter [Elainella sp. Prado103]|nr:cation:proton antiporter [Elainella sp. Prado103]
MAQLWQTLTEGWNFIMQWFTPSIFTGPITDPVPVFLTIIAIMLIAPLIFERIKLPGVVGLILAGVIVGPNGFGLLERDSTIVLLGTVGLLFLMFMAGLETSLDDLKHNANKAITFGLATFAVPMVLGIAAMMLLDYSWLAAILVASCFASHTLLALPVASKLGLMRSQAVTITLGGTLITNVLALLVLAIVVKAHQGNLTLSFWLFLIPSLGFYTFATLWGVPKLGRWFFRQFGHDEGAEFTFVVATLLVVSYAAELIDIEPIIGAFLAGIAITQLIPQLSPLMNRIQFIGNTLFVPFFLISVGMLVNPAVLLQEPRSLIVSGVMVTIALIAKWIAASGSGALFKWDRSSTMVVFGLSVAQAASTLAAITVAYQIELVDQLTVNGTIAMILVTCIASPWITQRWGQSMSSEPSPQQEPNDLAAGSVAPTHYRILVPVSNPNTEDNLLQVALLLAKSTQGTLIPLHILLDHDGAVTPAAKTRQSQLLAAAETAAHAAVTEVEPIGRIDDAIDKGILRTAQEQQANLIVCGWKGYSTYRDNFFGGAIDNVIRRTTVPVFITRFTHPIKTTQRVFLAIDETDLLAPSFAQLLSLSRLLAAELKASFSILHVAGVSRRFSAKSDGLTLPADLSVERVRGNFNSYVAHHLISDDLLILTAKVNTDLLGLSTLGVGSETIAHQNPSLSLMVMHIPLSSS